MKAFVLVNGVVIGVVVAVGLSGCSGSPSPPSAGPSTPRANPSTPTAPSPTEVEVTPSPSPELSRIRVTRDGDEVSLDFPKPRRSPNVLVPRVLGRLLPYDVASLRRDVRVVIGGGDGATLLPFEKVAYSEDREDWWVAEMPRFDGARAYVSGGVFLRRDRLVVLLDHFSDDRGGHPSNRHHGLWASVHHDLTQYVPYRPRFVPALVPAPRGWGPLVSLGASRSPDGVVWVTTWDGRLYVSTDAAQTFHETDVD